MFRPFLIRYRYIGPLLTVPLMLLGTAFDQTTLAPWQLAYATLYPLVSIAALGVVSRRMFDRHIVASQGKE